MVDANCFRQAAAADDFFASIALNGFASGRRCARYVCDKFKLPRRNGRSPGRSAAAPPKHSIREAIRRVKHLRVTPSPKLLSEICARGVSAGPPLRRFSGYRKSSTEIAFSGPISAQLYEFLEGSKFHGVVTTGPP